MRIVVITGGSRGIGASAAVQSASRGMGVILTYKGNVSADSKRINAQSIEVGGGYNI